MKKIAVLVSGGVDSSVALALLKQQGYSVTAYYLKIWLEDELSFLGECPWEEDLTYVRAVCAQLDVPLEIVSFQKEYWDAVVAYTIAQARSGRTPNPDVLCNKQIKFGAFYDRFGSSYDAIATGHYAQVHHLNGVSRLFSAPDPIKDQTYFLAHLNQKQLQKVVFPIGHLSKVQVRATATAFNLPNKDRKDSQGICFLGKIKFRDFLKHHLGELPGLIKEYETGRIVGHHQGYWFHTIGQRQGLGLSGGPWYVVAKNSNDNTVFVSRHYYDGDKIRDIVHVTDMNWITSSVPAESWVQVKLRHGPARHTALLTYDGEGNVNLKLEERDQGIAAGQFAVLYQDQECLGSGIIN